MNPLHLGPSATLPLKFLSVRKVVFGGSGSGKTAFGRVVYEEATAAGVLCGAIDLKGDWWGLKSSADGHADGIPVVIFGGEHQDVPLDPAGGAQLAEIVVELRQPFVIDLEQLSRGKQMRFLAAFFDRLYDRNREPLVLFCDEADRYAPQKPMSPDANECLGAVEDVAKRGRKHGIFPFFITQRNASLNKNVSELCDIAIVFRTAGPNDQDAVRDWFKAKATREQLDAVNQQLAGLPTGTAILCSAHPDIRLFTTEPIRMARTFDSSATPEIGKKRIEPKRLARPDLEQIRERMAGAIEQAKANDPKELRAQLAALKRELAAERMKPVAEAPEPKVEIQTVQVSVVTEKDLEQLGALEAKLEDMAREVRKVGDRLNAKWMAVQNQAPAPTRGRHDPPRPIPAPPPRPRNVERAPRASEEGQAPGLRKGARRMMEVLAAFHNGVTPRQLGVLAGIVRGGTFSSYLSNLRMAGYVEERPDRVLPTQAGLDAAGGRPRPSRDEVIAMHRRCLRAGAARMFDILVERYPKWVGREALSESSGIVEGGTFSSYLSNLRTRDLIDEQSGEIRASEDLFS